MAESKTDQSALKRDQRAMWDDSAAGWNKWWPVFERAAQTVSDRLVELAGVRPGARVLDIATGNGEPAVTAARVVGKSGHVVGVDQSPGMLAIARERAAALGLGNLEFVESDAESMALPAASFDACVCRWGLMFMPDLTGTLRTIRRALKPGAGLATAVWNSGDKVPMISLASDAVREIAGLKPPPPGALEPTRLADTSILKAALEATGFRAVAIEPMIVTFDFASPAEFIAFRSEVGRAQAMMAKLEPAVRARVQAAIGEAARKFQGADGRVRLPNETICFSARA
ncbi:MAG TPA: methyltransferase domain-containing protein [Candidatus Binataceae bacterium]|nr:methyltransferase domain-containing protein [Candidatus Binataceae bacterium]